MQGCYYGDNRHNLIVTIFAIPSIGKEDFVRHSRLLLRETVVNKSKAIRPNTRRASSISPVVPRIILDVGLQVVAINIHLQSIHRNINHRAVPSINKAG